MKKYKIYNYITSILIFPCGNNLQWIEFLKNPFMDYSINFLNILIYSFSILLSFFLL